MGIYSKIIFGSKQRTIPIILNGINQKVLFGIQSFNDRFYILDNGFVFDARSVLKERSTNIDKEDKSPRGEAEKHIEVKRNFIRFKLIGSQKPSEIIKYEPSKHYFSYGPKELNSKGYKKVLLKNVYDHIDMVYELHPMSGIKYSFVLNQGADIKDINFAYKNADNVQILDNEIKIFWDKKQILTDRDIKVFTKKSKEIIPCTLIQKKDNTLAYELQDNAQLNEAIIIDPWVSQITTLTTTYNNNDNLGLEIDYDVYGNLYVYGGGAGSHYITPSEEYQTAKYDPNGNLLWTFSGTLTTPAFSTIYDLASPGNIVTDKEEGGFL